MRSRARLFRLRRLSHDSGHSWVARLPADFPSGDAADRPAGSSLRLFEDGVELGPQHAPHQDIRELGKGRFSHWGPVVYLSSSDNSSPRWNRRSYTVLADADEGDFRTTLAAAANLDRDTLSLPERYAWAERLFGLFVPEEKLPDFGRSLFRDRAFLADFERFDRRNYRNLDRKFALVELLKLARLRQGEAAECGVYQGASAYLIAKALLHEGRGRRLHLFDSFAGLSPPEGIDGSHWRAGDLECSLDAVARNLEPVKDAIVYHPGWIPDRFQDVETLRFCFVHVDVDLHAPTLAAVSFFYPRLSPGGVLICDDYGFETCPGARRALDEFFADKPDPVIHLPTGQGVVIRGSGDA